MMLYLQVLTPQLYYDVISSTAIVGLNDAIFQVLTYYIYTYLCAEVI